MFDLAKDQSTINERAILRKLRVWIIALGVACLLAGIGVGAMLSGRPTVAQNEVQIAHAPEALSASFAEIARRVEPAVVNIETMTAASEVAEKDTEDKDDEATNNPLLDMFRRQARRPSRGVGSGFIVSSKGYILTNEHVVEGSTRIIVGLQSGEKYRGRVVGIDEETDVAVVKIEAPQDLPTVTLGDSNAAQVGDWVLAIGSPFGLDQTVTAGIISKKERETPFFTNFQRFLQTDAAINRGNSGGPLVNMRGEVIGINSQIATSTGDYNGIGFALPAVEANFVYRQILAQGKVRRGYLGVTLESVKDEYARVYGLAEAKGAIIMDVQPTKDGLPTPAAKAGMQSNDIITEFNGQPVLSAQDLIQKVAATPVGESASLTFLRDRDGKLEKMTASVVLGERPKLQQLSEVDDSATPKDKGKEADPKGNGLHLGVTLAELTQQLITEKHLTGVRGLYVKEVDPNGLAAEVRNTTGQQALNEGDVITRINRVPVSTLADFQRVISGLKSGDPIVLQVSRYIRDRVTTRIVQFTYQ
ncbi:MAG TPA: trypsin-like peptidase domain-containing protein [Pyrinomonadaceae bacterium]|jgi:serine protease Do|nr:trypsin-like peptidase domain-containing protein [Pyrinomonadaceae bacterium]